MATRARYFSSGQSVGRSPSHVLVRALVLTRLDYCNVLLGRVLKCLFSPINGMQGRHFNFFLGGEFFLLFSNATGLLKNCKKQHVICNLTLFIVPFFLFSLFSLFFLFFLFFFFSFSLGGGGGRRPPPSPPK